LRKPIRREKKARCNKQKFFNHIIGLKCEPMLIQRLMLEGVDGTKRMEGLKRLLPTFL
jgi:hypothetical protein